ncbi:hypothetical protein K435DRAFT_863527 [Dendrothele bispora CBS 962.96]|uniref:Uncharacterized protein n=1 Tax=Dendrothele bispora (strain CBS 962.96) TaxID=1314807 RepID=A0A4S8LPE5_DENBC|nr:hypothetical protein K435DRAFT_863527 [Dendrothele bispora CBS 962.96]
MATSLEDLPDGLLHKIIESLNFYKVTPIKIHMRHKPFRNRCLSHPVDPVSLVNRRLRRLSLPILFRKVCIRPYYSNAHVSDILSLMLEALKHNTLMPLIRELSIDLKGCAPVRSCEDPVTLLLIDVLSRCTRLEHLGLPETELGYGDQRPIIEALNSHSSENIRLQFMSIEFDAPESFNALRSLSLSRVICQNWQRRHCSDQEMKALLAQGLNIQSIDRSRYVDGSWMDGNYPGLTRIYGWNGNERSLQSTIDFLLRHPLLERIGPEAHECDMTPWHATFASKMYPYSFKIDKWNGVVKINGEWLYDNIKITFLDDIAHGDVETVETMVRTLRKALPQPSDCPHLDVGIDFLSPVGEYMTSDNLIGILTRNTNYPVTLNHSITLQLGTFVCVILIREYSQERLIAGFESFSRRLDQVLPRVVVYGQNPRGGLI